MPPVYNFRAPTIYSRDLEPPAAFHSRQAMKDPQRDRYAKAMLRVVHGTAEELGRKIGSGGAAAVVGGAAGTATAGGGARRGAALPGRTTPPTGHRPKGTNRLG